MSLPDFLQECSCGSGLERRALYDAAGIFCTFVCDKCEANRRRELNSRIFTDWYDPDHSDVYWPEKD